MVLTKQKLTHGTEGNFVHIKIPTVWVLGIISLIISIISGIIYVAVFIANLKTTLNSNTIEHSRYEKQLQINYAYHKGIAKAIYDIDSVRLENWTDPYIQEIYFNKEDK